VLAITNGVAGVIAVEIGEPAQRYSIGDAFAQLAIIPVLQAIRTSAPIRWKTTCTFFWDDNMSENAEPRAGDTYLRFNGSDAYVEIPSIDDYSVNTTGALTVSAWMKPDTLNFPNVESNSDYIHWVGKGDAFGAGGNQEWTFRMYNHHDPLDTPTRPNRISFYLFNPQGGLGVGSFVQVPIHKGGWIHLVGVADSTRTYFYKDGQYTLRHL
jgi:hypothetical protein